MSDPGYPDDIRQYDNDPQFKKFFKDLLPKQSERNKVLDEAIKAVRERKVLKGSYGLISKEITIQAIERLKE